MLNLRIWSVECEHLLRYLIKVICACLFYYNNRSLSNHNPARHFYIAPCIVVQQEMVQEQPQAFPFRQDPPKYTDRESVRPWVIYKHCLLGNPALWDKIK